MLSAEFPSVAVSVADSRTRFEALKCAVVEPSGSSFEDPECPFETAPALNVRISASDLSSSDDVESWSFSEELCSTVFDSDS